jgi:hypothetical protein
MVPFPPPRYKCNFLIAVVTLHVTLNIAAVSVRTGAESPTFTAAQCEEKGLRCSATHTTSAIVAARASHRSTTFVTYSGLYKEVGEETKDGETPFSRSKERFFAFHTFVHAGRSHSQRLKDLHTKKRKNLKKRDKK